MKIILAKLCMFMCVFVFGGIYWLVNCSGFAVHSFVWKLEVIFVLNCHSEFVGILNISVTFSYCHFYFNQI